MIYLLNALDQYHKFDNPWTTGKGRHFCEYALLAHDQPWEHAAIPMRAWEYNQPPIVIVEGGSDESPILETSGNIVVESSYAGKATKSSCASQKSSAFPARQP